MIDYKKYIEALRKCAKEHEYDRTPTRDIIVSYLCRDTADLLEALEQESCEDAVSRVDLIDKLEIIDKRYGSDFYWEVRKIVDGLPSVKPQQSIEK